MASPAKKKDAPAAAPAVEGAVENNVVELRQPVTVRGLDLLKLLEATGGMFLTQDEGQEAVDAGNVAVDMGNIQGSTAFVTLTDSGKALLAPVAKEKPLYDIDDDVPMPDAPKKRGGKRGSKYPFDTLELGQSFHVPKTKAMPNPVSALASSLTGARRRYEEPVLDANGNPVMETVKVKTYAKDKDGKRVKSADGKFVVSGETTVSKPKMKQTRDFQVFEVFSDDKKGPGARVYRTEPKN